MHLFYEQTEPVSEPGWLGKAVVIGIELCLKQWVGVIAGRAEAEITILSPG